MNEPTQVETLPAEFELIEHVSAVPGEPSTFTVYRGSVIIHQGRDAKVARLIAAGPELLAALKELSSWIDDEHPAQVQARAAIAKATR